MKKSYYIYNNGSLRRKDNTLTFTNENEEQKNLPIEQINDIYVMSEMTFNTSLINILSQYGVPVHFFNYYSFYTGMQDLVHDLPFDPLYNNYLICGHTHRRVIGEVVPGFMGVNVGSDYDRLESFVLEV